MLVVRHAVVGPFAANSWLASCGQTGEAVLIDPGGELSRVLGLLRPGGRVVRIFCTHGHIDHVAAGAEARALTGAPLQLHPADEAWLEALPRQAEMFGFDPVSPPAVDHRHADGETFPVGELEARVIHTPGHSAGSCSLLFPSEKVLFTGDTLFAGSVGRTDLPGGDFTALERSIRERLFPLGDDVRFHPGHGPSGTLGDERRANPFVGENPPRGRFV
jgi:glyoxylase-like metal-dependent hydrolase (beta-lactamase superfamily II)